MINSDEINFVIHTISFNWKALIDYYWSIVHEGRKVPVWGFEKQLGESKPRKTIVSGMTNALLQWCIRRLLPTYSFNKYSKYFKGRICFYSTKRE